MSYVRLLLIYLAALVATMLTGLVFGSIVLAMANGVGIKIHSAWAGWAFNIIPAFVIGFVLIATLTSSLIRWGDGRAPGTHLGRTWPLYACAVANSVIIARTYNVGDFWLLAQLFIMPGAATYGGVLGDLVASRRRAG